MSPHRTRQEKTSSSEAEELLRLSKRMSELGLCSRREADAFIEKGQVFVDGQRVSELGYKVTRSQKVELDFKAQMDMESSVTILLNKPVGFVSGQPEDNYEPAVKLLIDSNRDPASPARALRKSDFEGLAPAGRLDIDSQGLLIFTQDGRIAKQLVGEDGDLEKEYLVRVRGEVADKDLQLLRHGLELDGIPLKKAKIDQLDVGLLRFILKEGKKRQIRRMCDLIQLHVTRIKRVRIGRVVLGPLPIGCWRFLGPDERF
jgi:23S rRNA pseudouridine2604 synthase